LIKEYRSAYNIPALVHRCSLETTALRHMKKLLLICLAVFPALLLGFLILNYSVNVPFYDEWDTPGLALLKSAQGQLNFDYLIGQHNESRLLFPRLILIPLAYLTNWNIKYEMMLTFLLACLISFNIYKLSQISLSVSKSKLLIYLSLVNLLIFSPIQFENWLWGIQVITMIPIACLTTNLVILFYNSNLILSVLICSLLSTVSTFSYANGLLCWIIILPMIILHLWREKNTWKQKILYFLVPLIIFITNLYFYFYKYHKPTYHPKFSEALLHPLKALSYFVAFLGFPLGFQDKIASQIVGSLLIIFCTLMLVKFLNYSNSKTLPKFLPWIAISCYSLFNAIIVTLGRVGFGVNQALTSRYTTFSLYLIIGLIYLTLIDSYNNNSRLFSLLKIKKISHAKFDMVWQSITPLSLSIILILHGLTFFNGLRMFKSTYHNRLYSLSCLSFINFNQDNFCIEQSLYPSASHLRQRASNLFEVGFLRNRILTESEMNKLINKDSDRETLDSDNYGFLDILNQENNGDYFASGWAILPTKKRPADAVILAYKTSEDKNIAFTISDLERVKRNDVQKVLGQDSYENSGWKKLFPAEILPKNAEAITAWAFDAEARTAYQLTGLFSLK